MWLGVALFFGGWILLSVIVAWGWSRWFRYLRD
jgi:hypothetical protein